MICPARRTLTTLRINIGREIPRELLPGFELGGDQANFIDSSAPHNVNGAGYLFKKHRIIALYECDLFRTILWNLHC